MARVLYPVLSNTRSNRLAITDSPSPLRLDNWHKTSHQEWLLALTTVLQTTLDIENLLELFAWRMNQRVSFDGLIFETINQEIICLGNTESTECLPMQLVLEGKALGQLRFVREAPFETSDVELLKNILPYLIYPLNNAVVYREALKAAEQDPLTGIGNRSRLERTLETEVRRARRYGYPLSLVMIDADKFKVINDSYGHVTGDAVLKALAGTIQRGVRDCDTAFRYGGEEFCVLLCNTDRDGAFLVAERLRTAVELIAVPANGREVQVTISLGVATLQHHDHPLSLIDKADAALYRSKRLGRNRTTIDDGGLGNERTSPLTTLASGA